MLKDKLIVGTTGGSLKRRLSRERRDRIIFLIALINAPVGIKRPREQIMEELQRLVDEEVVASSWKE